MEQVKAQSETYKVSTDNTVIEIIPKLLSSYVLWCTKLAYPIIVVKGIL